MSLITSFFLASFLTKTLSSNPSLTPLTNQDLTINDPTLDLKDFPNPPESQTDITIDIKRQKRDEKSKQHPKEYPPRNNEPGSIPPNRHPKEYPPRNNEHSFNDPETKQALRDNDPRNNDKPNETPNKRPNQKQPTGKERVRLIIEQDRREKEAQSMQRHNHEPEHSFNDPETKAALKENDPRNQPNTHTHDHRHEEQRLRALERDAAIKGQRRPKGEGYSLNDPETRQALRDNDPRPKVSDPPKKAQIEFNPRPKAEEDTLDAQVKDAKTIAN